MEKKSLRKDFNSQLLVIVDPYLYISNKEIIPKRRTDF